MTTTREEFEAWITSETNVRDDAVWHEDKQRYTLLSRKQADWVLWQAAHLAGQRAMQDRAAVAAWSSGMDQHQKAVGIPLDSREVGSACAKAIRALEVKPS